MSQSGTQIHNAICNFFLDVSVTIEFINEYIDKDFDSEPFIEVERIVSTGRHIAGYIDVFLDFKTETGKRHVVAIEVKSSAGVVARDTNEIVRQMKKYKFYEPKITDMFLVYNIDDGDEPFGDDQVFIANGIKLLPFSGWFDDSGFNGWFEDNRDLI